LDRQPKEPASAHRGKGAPQEAEMTVEGDVATNPFVIVDNVPASQAAQLLSVADVKRLRSLHLIFEVNHSEAWIEILQAEINNEIERE
jgi:hypothetical protein